MPFASLPTGATLDYIDEGVTPDGTPVILVHGLLGTARMHFPRVIDWLTPQYRVLGPTLRGYGQSEPKPRIFPYDFYQRDAADLLAFMDVLGIDKAHLLGYSDGGEVALLMAGQSPERFYSVAVWGAVGYYGPAMRPVIQGYYPGEWITREESEAHGVTNPAAFILGWVQAVKRIIDSGGDLSLSLAPAITCPLLLMLGDQETLNPKEYGERFVAQTPNGRLQMFNAGHAIHDEAWDDFKQVVGAFMQEAAAPR